MDVYELAQKIPSDNPHKELILLAKLWEEAHKLQGDIEDIEKVIEVMEHYRKE